MAIAAINGVIAVGAINRIIAAIDAGPTGPAIVAISQRSGHAAHPNILLLNPRDKQRAARTTPPRTTNLH
jgi:hypothetical protein